MLWDPSNIKVFLDISTFCNAGCPQCHRTDSNGLGKVDWLPLVQWDLATFQKAFSPEDLQYINTFKFCGTFGDPVMCKELDKIFKYIIDNSETTISVDTNGSIRNEDWWWNVGVMCSNRHNVVFAVDGKDQEMHNKYRRFTDLEKVLSNMETLSMTNAIVHSQSVLFKHNQEYKDELTALVKKNGSVRHTFVISDRFDRVDNGKDVFIDENGKEDYFERADHEILPKGYVAGTKNNILSNEIICRWAKPRNEIVVNPDGQIMPCCYHANAHYMHRQGITNEMNKHDVYSKGYNKDLKKYNVFHSNLTDILNSEWFTKTLPQSINSDKPIKQCEKQCSSRTKKHHQIREYHDT